MQPPSAHEMAAGAAPAPPRVAVTELPFGRSDPAELKAYGQAQEMSLAGLAFSGGGIRSATFNLGVLQALAELKLLNDFDYLSTVSGGGYIGSWLAAWIKRGVIGTGQGRHEALASRRT
jgi:predicted acylesterase/phospholipase RssA